MTEPLEFQIMLALQARFQQIRVADGYFYGVDDVAVLLDPDNSVEALRATVDGSPRVRPFVAIEPLDGEEWNYEPANQLRFVLPMLVNWVHTAVPASDAVTGVPMPPPDAARLQVYWRGCADIEKALNRSNDPGLGGLATDVRIVDRKWIADREVGQDVWAQLTLHVHTRREFGKVA